MNTIDLRSSQALEMIDITLHIEHSVRALGLETGVITVFVPHTTAGITINESADPAVKSDVLQDFSRLIPNVQDYYQHFEGNSAAHALAVIVGSSINVIVEGGQLVLGRWQAIYFCEFDGPRQRKIHVSA